MHSCKFDSCPLTISFQLLEPAFLLNLTSHSAWVGFSLLSFTPLSTLNPRQFTQFQGFKCLLLYAIDMKFYVPFPGFSTELQTYISNCLLYIFMWKCNFGKNRSCLSWRYKFGRHLFKGLWELMSLER